nr:hypothetical protein [Marinitoga lauensis]
MCGRCIRTCSEVQSVNIFTFANRGPNTIVTTFMDEGMGMLIVRIVASAL